MIGNLFKYSINCVFTKSNHEYDNEFTIRLVYPSKSSICRARFSSFSPSSIQQFWEKFLDDSEIHCSDITLPKQCDIDTIINVVLTVVIDRLKRNDYHIDFIFKSFKLVNHVLLKYPQKNCRRPLTKKNLDRFAALSQIIVDSKHDIVKSRVQHKIETCNDKHQKSIPSVIIDGNRQFGFSPNLNSLIDRSICLCLRYARRRNRRGRIQLDLQR